MESSMDWLCLNPHCPQPHQRVFPQSHLHRVCSSCKQWVVSADDLLSYDKRSMPFDFERPLAFKSDPIRNQAYLKVNKDSIYTFLFEFAHTLKAQILRILDGYMANVKEMLKKIYKKVKLKEVIDIVKDSKTNLERSIRLSQLLQFSEVWEDRPLPSFRTAKELVTSLEKQLSQLTTLTQPLLKEENTITLPSLVKRQEPPPIQPQRQQANYNDRSTQIFSDEQGKQSTTRVSTGLRQYIIHNYNMKTAQVLIGQTQTVFYSWDQQQSVGHLICPCCKDKATVLNCPNRKASGKNAAKMILNHFFTSHPAVLEYNYSHHVTFSAVVPVTLREALKQMENSKFNKLIVVDRSSSFYYQHYPSKEEHSYAIEVLYYGDRPHSKCPYMKGGNSKEAQFLLGVMIGYAIRMEKAVQIHTVSARKELIDSFATRHGLVQVTSVAGQGRKETRKNRPTLTCADE